MKEHGKYNIVQHVFRGDDLPTLLRRVADFIEAIVDVPEDITYEMNGATEFFVTLYLP